MPKITREKFRVQHNVFDEFTNRTIYKLISEGHFEGLIGPVSIGKESNVFQARKKDGSKVIAKIYRLETCDFNRMYDYIRSDPRFLELKHNRRKVIFSWCKREYRNLLNAREAGVSVPTPYTCKNNVLVMELIGNDEAAPKLKDKIPKNMSSFFDGIIKNYIKLYQKASLVHADLSHFNILNNNEKPVFIDMSTSTVIDDPNAESYFQRDIRNIISFFGKYGMHADLDAVIKKIKKGG